MKEIFFILACACLSGCANVSTTKYIYTGKDGSRISVEMPKEMTAKKFAVKIGDAFVSADEITTKNVETIKAEAAREAAVMKAAGTLVEKGAQGAAQGAVKGITGGIAP